MLQTARVVIIYLTIRQPQIQEEQNSPLTGEN
jgi:hypothetical protein